MDNLKTAYFKCNGTEILLEKIKEIMETYDMFLIGSDGYKYTFDRDRSYSRSFIIKLAENGWVQVYDSDEDQMESLVQELSGLLAVFALTIGIHKDLLYYRAYDKGSSVDQYLSTFDYYEYPVDDKAISKYKGNSGVFSDLLGQEEIGKLQDVLDGCKDGNVEASQGYLNIIRILGIVAEKQTIMEEEDDVEDDGMDQEEIDFKDIFYVDFKSINIKIQDQQRVVEAVENIARELGFVKVDSFKNVEGEKKGFFSKIFNSVSERKRLKFFISPQSEGWVTLVGEQETLYGDVPSEWEFLNIEEELSQVLQEDVINIFADSERWGFKVFREGRLYFEYSSDDEIPDSDDAAEALNKTDKDGVKRILNSPIHTIEDIDSLFEEFCVLLKIKNNKINIPMDYSEEEYYNNVLSRLPQGRDFTNLRFVQHK